MQLKNRKFDTDLESSHLLHSEVKAINNQAALAAWRTDKKSA